MSRPGVTAEYGSTEYMQQALYSDAYTDTEKLGLLRKLDQSLQKNIERAIDELYADQTFVKRADTDDDERFVEALFKEKDELIAKAKDQIFNQEVRKTEFGNLPADEISALMAFATIDSLDTILDTSNGFLTGLEDGGNRNINQSAAREAAIADIVTRYQSGSTNYASTLTT